MCTIQKTLRVAFVECVGLLLLWMLLALVLPSAKADPPPQDSLYFKSRLGLMPPAYGLQPAEQRSPSLQAQANSGIFEPFVVYPSGSWPEAVTSGKWNGGGRNRRGTLHSVLLGPAQRQPCAPLGPNRHRHPHAHPARCGRHPPNRHHLRRQSHLLRPEMDTSDSANGSPAYNLPPSPHCEGGFLFLQCQLA